LSPVGDLGGGAKRKAGSVCKSKPDSEVKK
jgi:hypothetical protein